MRLLSIIVFTVVLISNTFGQTTPTTQVKTIADLVALRIPTINNRLSALVTGRVTENDGAGGLFFYDASDATSTNLGTVFKPAASAGRWVRQYSGAVDVKWFGAVGDDSTDSYAAITNALGVSSAVYISEGVYRVSNTIFVKGSGRYIRGDGATNSLLKATFAGVLMQVGSELAGDAETSPVQVESFGLNGNSIATYGLWIGGVVSPKPVTGSFNNLRITSCVTAGVRLAYAQVVSINDCEIASNAIGIQTISTDENTATSFYKDRIFANTAEGGLLQQAANFSFIQCNIESNGTEGIQFDAVDGTTIAGVTFLDCWFEDNMLAGGTGGANLMFTQNGGSTSYASGINIVGGEFNGINDAANNKHIYGKVDLINLNRPRFLSVTGPIELTLASAGGVAIGVSASDFTTRQNVSLVNSYIDFTGTGYFGGAVTNAASLTVGTGITSSGGLAFLGGQSITTTTGPLTLTPASGTNVTVSLTAPGALRLTGGATDLRILTDRDTFIPSTVNADSAHIFVSGAGAGDFGAEAGHLVIQPRVQGTVYRDIIFADGLSTPVELLRILGTGNVNIKNSLVFTTAGVGVKIKEGSNARMGTATLVGGTIAVANTSVTASTRVFISRSTTGGTEGTLSTTQIASTSFTVNSSSGTDTSTVNWLLIEPSP
jgi:hypothetical protein